MRFPLRVPKPLAVATVATASLIAVGSAAADTTIGSTTLPSGATMPVSACSTSSSAEVFPYATDAAHSYAVPAGGGNLTSWSFNTTGATVGTPFTLLVIRPSGTSYQIIATDPEVVPSGATKIATFTLSKPIAVQAGDLIGSVVTSKSKVGCMFKGSGVPSAEQLGFALTTPTVGKTFTPAENVPNEMPNVSATISQSNDVSLTQAAENSTVVQGDDGVFVLNVANTGSSSAPVTVTDTLPSGLSLVSASAGSGVCSTSAQTVTCQVPGAPASIALVVSAAKAGTYTNSATASSSIADPNPSNNSATQALTVNAPSSAGATNASTSGTASTGSTTPSTVPVPGSTAVTSTGAVDSGAADSSTLGCQAQATASALQLTDPFGGALPANGLSIQPFPAI
jgi:uncharacterized repeat protein (TIGR01451 family)